MKKLYLLLALASFLFPQLVKADITSMTGNQPGGLRGKTTPFIVSLFIDGKPAGANYHIVFIEYVSSTRKTQTLGTAVTGKDGRAHWDYLIPKDPNKDNIYLTGRFVPPTVGVPLTGSEVKQRVAIGR
jgi:hypothetical protein